MSWSIFNPPPPPRGDYASLQAAASMWSNIAGELISISSDVIGGARGTEATWQGAGGDSFRAAAAEEAGIILALGEQAAEVAELLTIAAQAIETAQLAYKTEMMNAARQMSSGISLGTLEDIGGLLAVLAVQFVPVADAAVDAGAAADLGDIVDGGEAAAAGTASGAASLTAAADASTDLEAVSASIGSRLADLVTQVMTTLTRLGDIVQAQWKTMATIGSIKAGETVGAEVYHNGSIDLSRINLGDVAIAAAAGAVGGALPVARMYESAVAGGLSTAGKELNNTGTIDPTAVIRSIELGMVGGRLNDAGITREALTALRAQVSAGDGVVLGSATVVDGATHGRVKG